MSSSRTRVIFTGAAGALTGLGAAVEAEGAQFTEWPLLTFARAGDPTLLEDAFGRLDRYAAVCITSPRAAEAVARVVVPAAWASRSRTRCWRMTRNHRCCSPVATCIGRNW